MKRITAPRACQGNRNAYRSVTVRDNDGLVPRKDAVEMWASATWLKGEPPVGCDLTPTQARRLAIELLTAAEQIEARP